MKEGTYFAAVRGRILAVALVGALGAVLQPMAAQAQETGGAIFGFAPAGQTVR